jgi:hypothetical protein
LNQRLCLEKRASNDPNSPFKENEKEGGEKISQLGGQWKVPLLGGPWKDPLFGGQWTKKEKHVSPSSHFSPNKFYLNLHFFH